VTFHACSSDPENMGDEENPEDYREVLPTRTGTINVLKDNATSYISEPVVSDSVVVFRGNTPDAIIPKTGECIFIPVSEKTPYGFLGKVISVERGADTKVFTRAAALDEVFETLSVDTAFTSLQIDGVFDAEGNRVAFELIDTALVGQTNPSAKTSKAPQLEGTMEIIDKALKFHFAYKEDEAGNEVELSGDLSFGFKALDLDIDIQDAKLNAMKLHAQPFINLSLTDEIKLQREYKQEKPLIVGKMLGRIVIPGIIPVIIPITMDISLVWGATGEISANVSLNYTSSSTCDVTYQNQRWNSNFTAKGKNNLDFSGGKPEFPEEKPDSLGSKTTPSSEERLWAVSSFNVKGEIYVGGNADIHFGLYSSTTGVGIALEPKYAVAAEASLTSEDLLIENPTVTSSVTLASKVYAKAELFGRLSAEFALKFPEWTIFEQEMPLLPEFENLSATRKVEDLWDHTDISYTIKRPYFLQGLGVKTGVTTYCLENNAKQDQEFTEMTKWGTSLSTRIELNKSNQSYYAAPYASWLGYTWLGDEQELQPIDTLRVDGFDQIEDIYRNNKLIFKFAYSGYRHGAGTRECGLYLLDQNGYHHFPQNTLGEFSNVQDSISYSREEMDRVDYSKFEASKNVQYGVYVKKGNSYTYSNPNTLQLNYNQAPTYSDGWKGLFFIEEIGRYETKCTYFINTKGNWILLNTETTKHSFQPQSDDYDRGFRDYIPPEKSSSASVKYYYDWYYIKNGIEYRGKPK